MYYGFTMPTITEGPNYRPVLCYLMRTITSQIFIQYLVDIEMFNVVSFEVLSLQNFTELLAYQ